MSWCELVRVGVRWSVVGANSSELGRVGTCWGVVGAGSSVVGASWSELGRVGVSSKRGLVGPVIVGKGVGEAVGAAVGSAVAPAVGNAAGKVKVDGSSCAPINLFGVCKTLCFLRVSGISSALMDPSSVS